METASRRPARLLIAASLFVALAGCSGEEETQSRERVAAAASDEITRKSWLQPTDGTPPDLWLASREAGEDLPPSAPQVATWRARLLDADERFGETDRMIANRAVQLQTMLDEIGIRESVEEILADFSALAAPGARAGFSDLCQHYYNLRAQRVSRTDALAVLRSESPAAAGSTP